MTDELVEKVARAIADYEKPVGPGWQDRWTEYRGAARAAIAAVRSVIRDQVLEEAAKVADFMGKQDEGTDGHGVAYEVAAAIRAMKDTP